MKLKFNVTGMTCAACSARVEKVTNAVPGVEKAEVNLLAGTMQVEAENGNVVPAIIKAVQDAGYNAALPGEKKTDKAEAAPAEAALKEMKKRIIGSAICLVVLMYFTMGHMIGLPAPHWYHGVKNALVADPSCGVPEPGVLQQRTESPVAPCAQHGFPDRRWLFGRAGLWRGGAVPHGLRHGT